MKSFLPHTKPDASQAKSGAPALTAAERHTSRSQMEERDAPLPEAVDAIDASTMSGGSSAVGGAAATLAVLSGLLRTGTASAQDSVTVGAEPTAVETQTDAHATVVTNAAPDTQAAFQAQSVAATDIVDVPLMATEPGALPTAAGLDPAQDPAAVPVVQGDAAVQAPGVPDAPGPVDVVSAVLSDGPSAAAEPPQTVSVVPDDIVAEEAPAPQEPQEPPTEPDVAAPTPDPEVAAPTPDPEVAAPTPDPGVIITAGGPDEDPVDPVAPINAAPDAPVLLSGGVVDENAAAGTVVATLQAFDADGDTLTYRFTDSMGNLIENDQFEIVGNEIHVKPDGSGINFESGANIEVFVSAYDGLVSSPPQQLSFAVNDMAEEYAMGPDDDGTFVDDGVTEGFINGSIGNDHITGGDGGQQIKGSSGADTIIGGDGNDYVFGQWWGDRGETDANDLSGGNGDDILVGAAGDDVLRGDAGNDHLYGEAGNDTLEGGHGDDTLFGGAGHDTMYGGAGNDQFRVSAGDDAIFGGDGADRVYFSGEMTDYDITFDAGTDTFTVTDQTGVDGADTVTGVETFAFQGAWVTSSQMQDEAERQANAAPEPASVASGGTVDEHAAAGTVVATLQAADAEGDAVTFALTDAAGNAVSDSRFEIVGNEIRLKPDAGLDFETSESFDVYVTASDPLHAGTPQQITLHVNDQLDATHLGDGGGTYTVSGADAEWIVGGDGRDIVTGGSGDDMISGGDGDDVLKGGAGDDTINGGALADNAIWDGAFEDFAISYSDNTYTIKDLNAADGLNEGTDTVTMVENFVFDGVTYSSGDIQVEAARQAQTEVLMDTPVTMQGDGLNENSVAGTVVATLQQNDTQGDAITYQLTDSSGQPVTSSQFEVVGNEVHVKAGALIDFETADQIDLHFTASDGVETGAVQTLGITVNDMAEVYYVREGEGTFTDTHASELSIFGSHSADRITGSDTGYEMRGDLGADTIYGGAGDDTMYAQEADVRTETVSNTLYGGGGDDGLYGAAGGDTLDGGSGHDTLYGDAGADFLTGGQGNDVMYGGDGDDIYMLTAGQGSDTITDGGSWTDTIMLESMGGVVSVTDTEITGDGWTIVLDGDSSVGWQVGDSIELSPDAVGTITFDMGGTLDFSGIDRVAW